MAECQSGSPTPELDGLLAKWLRDELTSEEYDTLDPDVRRRAEDVMRWLSLRAKADIREGRVYSAAVVRQRLSERLRGGRGDDAEAGA